MSDFTPIPEPGTPVYPEQVKMIMPGEFAAGGPGSPENTQAEALVFRTQWLRQKIAEIEAELSGGGGDPSEINRGKLETLEKLVLELSRVLEAQGYSINYDNVVIEDFDSLTEVDQAAVAVSGQASGQKILDCSLADVMKLIIGAEYTLTDGSVSERVVVENLLVTSGTCRIYLKQNCMTQLGDGCGHLYRTTASIVDGRIVGRVDMQYANWTTPINFSGASAGATVQIGYDFSAGNIGNFVISGDMTFDLDGNATLLP